MSFEFVRPADDWQNGIEQAVNRADVAILLISPHFLASEFIRGDELPRLLDAAESRGMAIISVILAPCLFARHPALTRFQTLNRDIVGFRKDLEERLVELERAQIEIKSAVGSSARSARVSSGH